MKTTIKNLCLLLMLLVMMTSCSTERRALSQMRTLTHDIETKGQTYDRQDWQDAYAEYKTINDKMDVQKLNREQQREYGELQARCVAGFAKCQVENVVDQVKAWINQGSGFVKGLMDAIEDLKKDK